jgi:hypothetical protein
MDDPFRPTWRRGLLAALAAAGAFCMPQKVKVPLEFYPLNHPGDDILYLEITCASDTSGFVRIWYDTTEGFNEFDSLRWPISPTQQSYTYTFPLPDAPIVALRLDPLAHGGTLTITQMQIVDRRGHEIRRFTRDMFVPLYQIASIAPIANGWNITSKLDAIEPKTPIAVMPIVPAGMNNRNLQRCLLSTGYLALMLWILLLAVLFAFYRPTDAKSALIRIGFMAGLALLFSFAGNRRLIRDAIHFALYVPTAPQGAPTAPLPTAQTRILVPTDVPSPDDVNIAGFIGWTAFRQNIFGLRLADRRVALVSESLGIRSVGQDCQSWMIHRSLFSDSGVPLALPILFAVGTPTAGPFHC